MKFLFTTQWWLELDTFDEALDAQQEGDKLHRERIFKEFAPVMVENDMTMEDIGEVFGYIGTTVQRIDVETAV